MRRTPEITLRLDLGSSDGPLPDRIAEGIKELIGSEVLAPSDPLPSSRALAEHLQVSRGSVVACYEQLLAEGYLSASVGRSTIVNPLLRRVQPRPSVAAPAPVPATGAAIDLRPGLPWQGEVVSPAWRAAWRRASAAAVTTGAPPLGWPGLQRELADHLRRMRGVVRPASQLAVTAGGREGLALVLLALAGSRPLRVGVEEPGYPSLRRVPARFGATLVGMPVDASGLRTDALPSGDQAPDVLLITPSHQYPLGGTLPVDRRQRLLEWAQTHRVTIVEDDYDSELRYTSRPVPALAALDDPANGCVVLLGTLAKTLSPTLAVGFLALPERLVPAVREVRSELGQPVGLVTQRAVTDYLEAGALRLHTQRMRQRYRRRRDQVVAALAGIGELVVHPMDGGLHAVVETSRPEAEMVADLAAAGVLVSPLGRYWAGEQPWQGIVLGFGGVSDEDLAAGLAAIAATA